MHCNNQFLLLEFTGLTSHHSKTAWLLAERTACIENQLLNCKYSTWHSQSLPGCGICLEAMNNVSCCSPNVRFHMSGHQWKNMWAVPLFTNSSNPLINGLPLPALVGSASIKTLLWSVTGHFKVIMKQEQRRELLRWLGWLIINTKWGEGEILLLFTWICFGGKSYQIFKTEKNIYSYCLDTSGKKLSVTLASKWRLWPTNRSACLGKVNVSWVVEEAIINTS